MLNDAHARKFDRIIFIKLDRFFRSVAEYHECMKYIDPVLWTATEEKYDLTTANGRAFVNMKLTIAELEADQTGERIKIVNDYKVKTGQALTGAQSLTIGYKVENIDGVKRVVKNPDTKDMVTDYINYFLTYQNKRRGHVYIKDKYNVNISYNTLSKLLSDTKIYGSYRGNDSYCEPYVDKTTFDKIQKILKKNIKQTSANRIYLFSGIINCPICGNLLTGKFTHVKSTKNRYGKVYKRDNQYYSYRCNKHFLNTNCNFGKQVNEGKIEKALLDNLDQYVNSYIETAKIEDVRKEDKNLDDKIKKVKTEITKVKRMYRKEDMTEAEYDEAMDELKEELQKLESQLEPQVERDLTIYEELLKSEWKALYNALNKENKRAFWRKHIKSIVIDKTGVLQDVIFF